LLKVLFMKDNENEFDFHFVDAISRFFIVLER
jgi:hypothetical protein